MREASGATSFRDDEWVDLRVLAAGLGCTTEALGRRADRLMLDAVPAGLHDAETWQVDPLRVRVLDSAAARTDVPGACPEDQALIRALARVLTDVRNENRQLVADIDARRAELSAVRDLLAHERAQSEAWSAQLIAELSEANRALDQLRPAEPGTRDR
ncbi:MAG: hypothetical protein U0821_27695 [Chloroflexota bacterium]